MDTPTSSPDKPKPSAQQAAETYKKLKANLDAMGEHVLIVMRHPDSTPEDQTQAADAYRRVFNSWVEVRTELRKKWPRSLTSWRPYPWQP